MLSVWLEIPTQDQKKTNLSSTFKGPRQVHKRSKEESKSKSRSKIKSI